MKVKRLMASLLCGAIGAATLGLSGCGSAADSGMMDAANTNAVAGGSSDLPVVTWKMGSTWGDGNIHFTCDERFSELVSQLTDGRFTITNYPEGQSELCEVENNPAVPEMGMRQVSFSREIWVDGEDFMEVPVKKYFRLFPGNEVRLKGAYFVTCQEVIKNADGSIKELHCTYDPETKSGSGFEGRKVKGTIHFVDAQTAVPIKIRQFDYLMTEGEDGKMVANEDTMREITCYAEPKVLEAQSGERFQFFRHGYFVADSKLYSEDNPVFNEIIGLKSSWKK